MANHYIDRKVTIIGHKHPDTDSVCSAIAYAWLKNQNSDTLFEAKCAGAINRETEFVLNYFGVEHPEICEDVSPQVKNIEFSFCQDKVDGIDYKDIAKLRKFVSERAKILPRRVSGNCALHQRQLTVAIKRARQMALLPYVAN